ncbi:MAG: hypothetical protein DMG05_09645 [Acidobacteria bacterium]|nr:MAG: hypothetical protein DMG05_09645 [Acidobacteriota bacterium]
MEVDPSHNSWLSRHHHHALIALTLIALSANLLFPGEVFFQSKFLLIFASLFTFAITFIKECRIGNPHLFSVITAALFPLLILIPSTFKTINGSRSEDVFWLFLSYACLFLTLRLSRFEPRTILASILAITLVGFCVDLFCVYQYFFGLFDLKSLVLRSTALDEGFKTRLLARIATKRVFANFPLPNTLAGFVTMVFPLNLFLIHLALDVQSPIVLASGKFLKKLFQNPVSTLLLFLQLSLSLLILALTQSFGGWVCFCSSMLFLCLVTYMRRKISIKFMLVTLLGLFVIVAGWMVWLTYRRGFSLWNLAASENPITLRWINYKTALNIFRDFPLTGVGLGNYGGINPRYQSSLQNVTQYAHNTLLQLLSECGIPFFVLIMFVSMAITKYWRSLHTSTLSETPLYGFLQTSLAASLLAWLIHNSIDIDLYFPSLGALGIFLLGLWVNLQDGHDLHKLKAPEACLNDILYKGQPKDPSFLKLKGIRNPDPKPLARLVKGQYSFSVATVLFAILLIFLCVLRSYGAQALYSLAIDHAEANDLGQAERLINKAVAIKGNDAPMLVLKARLRYINSVQGKVAGLDHLIFLKEAYEKATKLEPYNANYHYELSRVLYSLGDIKLASLFRNRAIELFPSQPIFKNNLGFTEKADQKM